MNRVVAIKPVLLSGGLHHLLDAYKGWKEIGGRCLRNVPQPRPLHYFYFHWPLPSLGKWKKKGVRLRFVSSYALLFDTFPHYATHEIIPMFWDCWPKHFEKVCCFLQRYKVQTAIFTSSMTAARMKQRFPHMNILSVPEGIDISPYYNNKKLAQRSIDILEFGRDNRRIIGDNYNSLPVNHLYPKNGGRLFKTDQALYDGLADSKICLAFPRCDTMPEVAGDIETLTQRYWECMLSGSLMIGRAPKELIDLIGYNPVIDYDQQHGREQVLDILQHIDRWQSLADQNYQTALKYAPWSVSMQKVKDFLLSLGYMV